MDTSKINPDNQSTDHPTTKSNEIEKVSPVLDVNLDPILSGNSAPTVSEANELIFILHKDHYWSVRTHLYKLNSTDYLGFESENDRIKVMSNENDSLMNKLRDLPMASNDSPNDLSSEISVDSNNEYYEIAHDLRMKLMNHLLVNKNLGILKLGSLSDDTKKSLHEKNKQWLEALNVLIQMNQKKRDSKQDDQVDENSRLTNDTKNQFMDKSTSVLNDSSFEEVKKSNESIESKPIDELPIQSTIDQSADSPLVQFDESNDSPATETKLNDTNGVKSELSIETSTAKLDESTDNATTKLKKSRKKKSPLNKAASNLNESSKEQSSFDTTMEVDSTELDLSKPAKRKRGRPKKIVDPDSSKDDSTPKDKPILRKKSKTNLIDKYCLRKG